VLKWPRYYGIAIFHLSQNILNFLHSHFFYQNIYSHIFFANFAKKFKSFADTLQKFESFGALCSHSQSFGELCRPLQVWWVLQSWGLQFLLWVLNCIGWSLRWDGGLKIWEFGLLEKREMGSFLWRSELVGTLLIRRWQCEALAWMVYLYGWVFGSCQFWLWQLIVLVPSAIFHQFWLSRWKP